MKDPFKDMTYKGKTAAQRYQEILREQRQRELHQRKQKLKPKPEPIVEQTPTTDTADYILLEATSQYPDTLVSTTTTYHNNTWHKTHELLQANNQHMPTIKQFADFLRLLKSGRAFDGDGQRVSPQTLEHIFNEITEVRDPWRAEWLDADFKVINTILHINYNHNGQQPNNSEPLQSYLQQDKTPGIDLEHWINNPTQQGLPSTNTRDGTLHYWAPMTDNNSVARFYAYSDRAYLSCNRFPRFSDSSLGVRLCAKTI